MVVRTSFGRPDSGVGEKARTPPGQRIGQIRDRGSCHRGTCLVAGVTGVRSQDDIRQAEEGMIDRERFRIGYVQSGPEEVAGPERRDERVGVDQGTPRGIHHHRPRLHHRQLPFPDQAIRLRSECRVQ